MATTSDHTGNRGGTKNIAGNRKGGILEKISIQLNRDPSSINRPEAGTGMTLLHKAAATRDLSLGRLLFEHKNPKADPWIKDRWGRLAVDLALETGNQTLIDLFHRHMFPEDYENDFDPLDPPEGATPVITPKPGL